MRLSFRSIVILIGMAVCIIAIVAVFVAVDARKNAQRAKAAETLSDGRTAAAQDASAVRDRADERTSEIDTAVKGGTDEIRNAPDDASAGAAALRSLCRLNPDRDARCRVLDPAPRRMD